MISMRIRELRKQAKLSQEMMAEKIGVSRQAITKWETGLGVPDIENLVAIADLFKLSLDELMGRDIEHETLAKDYLYESVTEYDIDGKKDFDISFMGANKLKLYAYEGEKVKVILLSDTISDIQNELKTKIDDIKWKIDIDIKRVGNLSETVAKNELTIKILIPQLYMGEVELNGNTNILELKNLELDNIEFSGKSKEIILENIKSHIEIDTNEDAKLYVKNVEGALDINQLSATSKLYIASTDEFGFVTKGVLNKVLCKQDMLNIKEVSEEPKLVIELNGIKSELSICHMEDSML
ncbi:MAG: helix-turn-helix transcriptional regulator [Candidatus Nanosynbacter sp.]|nr:helix-turn-helix transcriptional regulator [Candidatus Nanosynbacter sp.]